MQAIEKFVYFYKFHVYGDEAQFFLICAYLLAGLVGLVVGSFLNVVIYRVPERMSLSYPPSHCPKCNYKLKWYDNIPILSYIILGGKCRNCKSHISFRYTIVEFLNMALWLLCVFVFLDGGRSTGRPFVMADNFAYMIICMIACSVLLCMAFIDLEHTYIPDSMQIIVGVLGVLAIAANLLGFNDGIAWYDRLIGAGACLVLFLIIYGAGYLAYKREAMGIGDIKLVAVGGLLLGWQNMIVALIIGVVAAAIVLVIVRRARNDEKQHEYPLGPFLVAGMLVAMFVGTPLLNMYMSLMN